jgi:hypothetical protein
MIVPSHACAPPLKKPQSILFLVSFSFFFPFFFLKCGFSFSLMALHFFSFLFSSLFYLFNKCYRFASGKHTCKIYMLNHTPINIKYYGNAVCARLHRKGNRKIRFISAQFAFLVLKHVRLKKGPPLPFWWIVKQCKIIFIFKIRPLFFGSEVKVNP